MHTKSKAGSSAWKECTIGNERLQAIEGDQVRLRVRVNAASGQPVGKRSITIDGVQFIARLLLHVLPPGFKRIRHYGLLAAAVKSERLAQARALLRMPQPNAQAMEDAQAFMRRVAALHIERCAHCASGRWQVVGQCPADRLALARVPPLACRGPP